MKQLKNSRVYWAVWGAVFTSSFASNNCFLFDSYEFPDVPRADADIDGVNVVASLCANANDCSEDKPLCVEGQCQSFCNSDAQCKQKYATSRAICSEGNCVECTSHVQCAGQNPSKPACLNNQCVSCMRNFQCPDSACDIDTGKCHDKSRIVYVNNADVNCTSGNGQLSSPYCDIQTALRSFSSTKDLILVQPGKKEGYRYSDTITIRQSLRIVGGGEWKEGNPNVLVASRVFVEPLPKTSPVQVALEDLHLTDCPAASAIGCARYPDAQEPPISLKLRYMRVSRANDWGLWSRACAVEVTSSTFTENKGGLYFEKSDATLINNMIVDNLGNGVHFNVLSNSANYMVAFNTIVNNKIPNTTGVYNIFCNGIDVPVFYNILTSYSTGQSSASNCKVYSSVVQYDATGGGSDNITDFIPMFKNRATSDYHLTPEDSIRIRRAWSEVTRKNLNISPFWLQRDFDGEARDKRSDNTTDIGADQYIAMQ